MPAGSVRPPSRPRSNSGPTGCRPLARRVGHVQATVAVPRDVQEAHRRRFFLAPDGERELPPQPLDRAAATLGLDRPAERLVDRANLRRAGGRVGGPRVSPSRSLGSFGTVRVEDERAPHAERRTARPRTPRCRAAKPGRSGTRPSRSSRPGRTRARRSRLPGRVFDEPVQGRPPRVERGRPGLDVGDVLEPARDRLEQSGLLARRPEEDARGSFTRDSPFRSRDECPAYSTRSGRHRWTCTRRPGRQGLGTAADPARKITRFG